jgi:hypothetical protein
MKTKRSDLRTETGKLNPKCGAGCSPVAADSGEARIKAIKAIGAALDELMPDEDDVKNKPERLVDVAETALKLKIPHVSVKIICTYIGQP